MWYVHTMHTEVGVKMNFLGFYNPEEIIPPEYLIDDLDTRQDLAIN